MPTPRCPWRKPPKHPMDRAHRISNFVVSGFFGALIVIGPAIQLWFAVLINEQGSTWWPVEILAAAVAITGFLGLIFGDRFVDWLADNWEQFVRYGRYGGG